jgi:hypothetical protein
MESIKGSDIVEQLRNHQLNGLRVGQFRLPAGDSSVKDTRVT